jgi:hypothetical protein
MLPNEIDDRDLCARSVVQIGDAVAESRAEVKKRARWFASHARIAIGRTGDHTLKQTQNTAYFRDSIEGRDEVNLRSAGICEARFNPTCHE